MKTENRKLTCHEVKQWNMVDYLDRQGFQPVHIRNTNAWYHSPLRHEKTASFKVNTHLNRWYDFGIGKGGNLIDFCVLYHQCSVKELLKILSGDPSFQSHNPVFFKQDEPENSIEILDMMPLQSRSLLQYLSTRKIPLKIATVYCIEVRYRVRGKQYIAIGFKNNSGGYELRSPFFKGSSAPKDITLLNGEGDDISVFEGFFDFLTHRTLYKELHCPQTNYIILNSIALFEKALPLMELFENKLLYLDRDNAGHNYSRRAQAISKQYIDASRLYKGYKDFNDWWVNGNTHRLPK